MSQSTERPALCGLGGGLYLHADSVLYQFIVRLGLTGASRNDINRIMRKSSPNFDISRIGRGELGQWLDRAQEVRP